MSHLTDDQLSALADGALAGGARASAERHLESCADCRESLAGLVARDRALAASLEHDPGEAYFESFAGRVGGRLRAAGLAGAQSRGPATRNLADWFQAPRKLALVGAVATVVVGAGIVMITSREARVPALGDREIANRVAQEASPAPPPPASRAGARGAPAPAMEPAAGLMQGSAASGVDSRAKSGVAPLAPSAAPAPEQRVATNRAYQVRRNEAGEDVAVKPPGGFAYPPHRAAPAPPPAAPGEPVYVRKPQYAEPLAAGKSATTLRGGAQPTPAEAPAPAPSVGQRATAAAGMVALEEQAKAAPAPAAEPVVTARKESAGAARILRLADRGALLQVRGAPEAFDGLAPESRALAQNAQRLTGLAETIGLAPAWDSAAASWERLIGGVQGGPLESETRFQIARARFQAWQRAATAKRGTQAGQALRTFLERAPEGAERDSAQVWLARLKR